MQRTKAAVARLRAYKPPPFPLWDRLPVSRRAAVLLLLYADKRGDLRVVITMRAASLRSFSGHAALPGGKADSKEETPYQIARREAWEEIGLPMDDSKIPAPFRIEHLCYLPMNLARTELVVRPCVALLHTAEPPVPFPAISPYNNNSLPTAEQSLIPRLDPKEVAAVFSAPFHNFLTEHDETPPPLPEGNWYDGSWTDWHEEPWRMHFFHVPVTDQTVAKPKVRDGGLAALSEVSDEAVETGRYKVWGMTARILVDAATIAYGEKPEFESNSHFGDEKMIEGLDKLGRLGEKKRRGSALTGEDSKKAAAAAAAAEVDKKKDGGGAGEGSKM
ncbi:NUDIX hydrolase domain-like protein [Cladorrhinum sp. PSN332]|nr:NUDIX hydrolase domain-like protein [Cladorrhinum sp. PSN332]